MIKQPQGVLVESDSRKWYSDFWHSPMKSDIPLADSPLNRNFSLKNPTPLPPTDYIILWMYISAKICSDSEDDDKGWAAMGSDARIPTVTQPERLLHHFALSAARPMWVPDNLWKPRLRKRFDRYCSLRLHSCAIWHLAWRTRPHTQQPLKVLTIIHHTSYKRLLRMTMYDVWIHI